jgi:citrate lyase subunit beta/citryl-CoA lyase
MFPRAFASGAHAVILDLEDAVPADQKAAAREAVAGLSLPPGWQSPVFVRLNAVGTPAFDADLVALAGAPVQGVILPKVERAAQVQEADAALPARPGPPLALILLVETPGGIVHAAELADSGVRRVSAFAFGAEDYRAGMRVDGLDPALADFARATIANAAAAAGVPAIDAPELDLSDDERLRTATRRARALGFTAKFAIHPSQVPLINDGFLSAEDRAWAARVMEAYQRAVSDGRGSVAVDGRMIDAATIRRATDILRA